MVSTILKCYLWRSDNELEALCVDFDIAAQGETYEEAFEQLKGAIETYVEYVHSLPQHEHLKFFTRRSPLALRIKLALFSKITGLLRPVSNNGPKGTVQETFEYATT